MCKSVSFDVQNLDADPTTWGASRMTPEGIHVPAVLPGSRPPQDRERSGRDVDTIPNAMAWKI
jgi:hypothetical protein